MSEELSDDKLFDDVMSAEVSTEDVKEHRKQKPIKDAKADADVSDAGDQPDEGKDQPSYGAEDLDALKKAMEAGAKEDDETADDNGRVPLAELRREREKRQALEDRIKELEQGGGSKGQDPLQARLDQLERFIMQQRQQPPAQQEEAQGPDFWEDPLSHLQAIQQSTQEALHQQRVQFSMDLAETKYGDEFQSYFDEVKNDPRKAARAWQSPNPGEEIMKIGRESKFMTETGGDLDKYGETMKQKLLGDPDFQRQVIEHVQKSLTGGVAAPNPGAIPASVSSGAGQRQAKPNSRATDMNDETLFAAVINGQI